MNEYCVRASIVELAFIKNWALRYGLHKTYCPFSKQNRVPTRTLFIFWLALCYEKHEGLLPTSRVLDALCQDYYQSPMPTVNIEN